MFFLFLIKLLIGTVLYLTGPRTLFPEACSTLLYSSDGQLLGARIAPDGQWRFPPADTLPDKFVTCLLTYEDKRFYQHRSDRHRPGHADQPQPGQDRQWRKHDHHAVSTDRTG